MSAPNQKPAPVAGNASAPDAVGGADGRAASRRRAESRSWTVLELLRWTTRHFQERGIETARLDAECLLGFALGVPRLRLYLDFEKPVTPAERGVFRGLVERRGRDRVPVAQLTGTREFWSLPLRVTRNVLTPRPETEALVQAVLDGHPEREGEARVLEVGTGSGAVALALARERPRWRITATDVAPEALAVARGNAERLGLAARIRWVEGSLYGPVAGERFDVVVSNPPYVAESQRSSLPPELAHEPAGALFAGPDGLGVLEPLVRGAAAALAPGGQLALEMGPEQAERVAGWCRDAGLHRVQGHRDLAGRLRVVTARGSG